MATANKVNDPKRIKGIKFNSKNMEISGIIEKNPIKLYVNAFPIVFTRDIQIHHYPFEIEPGVEQEFIISKVFTELSIDIFKDYGYFYRSGKYIYTTKEVLEPKDYTASIVDKGKVEYSIRINKKEETSIIKKDNSQILVKFMKK